MVDNTIARALLTVRGVGQVRAAAISALAMPLSVIPGQFFRQFGLTVAVAVFFSLVVARLLTPMMAAYWLQEHPPQDEGPLP